MTHPPGLDPRARLALGALATWRLAHLIAAEDGPGDVLLKARMRVGNGPLGTLMDCFECVSVWVAAPIAGVAMRTRRDAWLAWLGLSGAACMLERMTANREASEEVVDNGLLRTGPGRSPERVGEPAGFG